MFEVCVHLCVHCCMYLDNTFSVFNLSTKSKKTILLGKEMGVIEMNDAE